MNKKYELIDETQEWNGRILHRIRALADFGDVKAGELGGWIEKEENLSHNGDTPNYGLNWSCRPARSSLRKSARTSGHSGRLACGATACKGR